MLLSKIKNSLDANTNSNTASNLKNSSRKNVNPNPTPTCNVGNVSYDNSDILQALEKTKRLLQRSPSQETLNIIFKYNPHVPLKKSGSVLKDILGESLKDSDKSGDLELIPLENVFGSDHFSKERVKALCGVLGDTAEDIGAETVVAHKIILATFSDVLRNLYSESSAEKQAAITSQLKEMNAERKIISRCILWMYTGRVKLGKHTQEIKMLAQRLGMKLFLKHIQDVTAAGRDNSDVKGQPSEERMELTSDQLQKLVNKDSSLRVGQKTSAARLIGNLAELIEKEQKETKLCEKKAAAVTISAPQRSIKYDPSDFYKITTGQGFIDLPIDEVFHLLSSDDVSIKTELHVYIAAVKWLNHDFDKRKQYLLHLMECPRWFYMTTTDMIRVRNVDHQFFQHEEVVQQVSRAKWYQDLQERGIEWKAYKIPKNRTEKVHE